MLTAALDTSARTASFCVFDTKNANPVVMLEDVPTGRDSSALFSSIFESLHTANIDINDIRQWTIGMGPGSFTGIRVGAAFVKGVCAASSAAYRGVPTSFSMAMAGGESVDDIAVLHDGRRGEVLVSGYTREDAIWRAKEPARAYPIEELSQLTCDRFVMLLIDRAIDKIQTAQPDRLFVLKSVPVKQLLAFPDWPSVSEQEASVEPVYVRPAVFVEPQRSIAR